MKPVTVLFVCAISLCAQSPTAIPPGSITATIAPQGTDPIKQITGMRPKNAALVRVDTCNGDQSSDHNVSTSRIVSAIELKEQVSVYESDVVKAVLVALQQKDIYTKAQKIIAAGGNVVLLLSALFKTFSPTTAFLVNAGPQIAAALLPAVTDQRDFAILSEKLLTDNTALVLGREGSGSDCQAKLLVVMAESIKIDTVNIQ